MKKDEKILVWQDAGPVSTFREKIDQMLPLFQRVVDSFIALGLGDAHTESVWDLCANPVNVVDRRAVAMMPETIQVGEVTMFTDKALQLGLIPYPGAAKGDRDKYIGLARQAMQYGESCPWDVFAIGKDNKVYAEPGKVKAFEDHHTVFAETPEEVKAYQLLQKAGDAVQQAHEYIRQITEKRLLIIRGNDDYEPRVWWKIDHASVTVNPRAFKNIKRAMRSEF